MKIIDKLTPRVSKRILFFIAAMVWLIAADRVLNIALTDGINNSKHWFLFFSLGVIGALLFFKNVFYKVYIRNIDRIINSPLNKHCMFSFFDIKGFVTMAFMITLGISLRNLNIIPKAYLGSFYIVIGGGLFLAAISFMYAGIKYEKTKVKFYRK